MWEYLTCCFPCILDKTPTLRINGASFKILDLLGEGGFSYVYLVQSQTNHSLYALKKINCPYGDTNFQQAMKEVENYREFKSPYIMKSIDSSVVQEKDGSKTIYIILPYFENGSLQDIIDKSSVNKVKMNEDEVLRLFIGICRGLIALHRHQLSKNYQMILSMDGRRARGGSESEMDVPGATDTNDNEEDNPFLSLQERQGLSDEDPTGRNQLPGHYADADSDTVVDLLNAQDGTELTETVSMAHRDIKPGNLMLSKDGTPVLSDLGSCDKAQVLIQSRSQAITLQEFANEHCTLAYRAPELLDIKTGDELDEKVDIWSLGCTLYALLYGCSPFEREEIVNGANITLAIQSGNYSFPDEPIYRDGLKLLVQFCLVIEPKKRPSIEEVLSKALDVQRV
ncbi:hypothetical protein FOA43_000120 [Brettanomyces nanus]|uniref:non-specific serine/threonine protein kinase n=1 Tax=Eeniella nana TaxID=13502 RepID=A0A875RWH5_EENNA|nr:uncharacterized protein FOA43_000120 [Brettanomyces nanus]QPG72818.1 hypothetical protein FOA43_000120 [Brettanomyces nanus]